MERLKRQTERLGAARMWRNPPVRRLVWLLASAFVLALVGVWVYADLTADRLREEWLAQQTAIIGQLAASDPEQAKLLAARLAHPQRLTSEEMEQGRLLAEQYGLTPELGAQLSPILNDNRARTWMTLGVGLFVFVALLAVLLLREYRRQLTEIRKLAVSLENAVKHNRPMEFRIYEEGETGLLANNVQELAVRLQETIGQLHKDKDFLKDTVADISHQLKTPLASLIIYVDLLQEGKADEAASAEFLATCRRELDRMEWLIQTLLKIARLEADALPLQISPSPIAHTVQRACDAVRRLAEERAVTVVAQSDGEAADEVPHDSRWLAEAIANLLKNAVEISPRGGQVRVRWETTPVFLRLSVEDDGPGIDERHLSHIFRKFYRASGGGSGVGLGLPLAKSIVERHGGVLSANSRPEGGARFSLTLPVHPLPTGEISKSYENVRNDPVKL